MLKHRTNYRRLIFQNCEQRLLLTDACSADATEPEEVVAEVAPTEPDADTVDENRKLGGAADVTQEVSVDPAERLLVEVTVELVVPHEDVYQLAIEQAGDPTADEGLTGGPNPPPGGDGLDDQYIVTTNTLYGKERATT